MANIDYDLKQLTLTGGTYTITVRAQATGYKDSVDSNSVNYTVSGGYTVTVSGSVENNGSLEIYDGQNSAGTLLFNLECGSGPDISFSETLSCTTGYLYIYLSHPTMSESSYGTPSSGITLNDAVYMVTANGTIVGICDYGCIAEGTLITLADGSKKAIEDITYDDSLLVWNFYEGKFDSAKPMWIMPKRIANRYNVVTFDNGAILKLIGSDGFHRIYNDEAKEFTHTGTPDTPVGTKTFTEQGSYTYVVDENIVEEPINYCNIITDKHYNLFAEGILTSCRLSNRYGIENMKYTDEVKMTDTEVQDYINNLNNR